MLIKSFKSNKYVSSKLFREDWVDNLNRSVKSISYNDNGEATEIDITEYLDLESKTAYHINYDCRYNYIRDYEVMKTYNENETIIFTKSIIINDLIRNGGIINLKNFFSNDKECRCDKIYDVYDKYELIRLSSTSISSLGEETTEKDWNIDSWEEDENIIKISASKYDCYNKKTIYYDKNINKVLSESYETLGETRNTYNLYDINKNDIYDKILDLISNNPEDEGIIINVFNSDNLIMSLSLCIDTKAIVSIIKYDNSLKTNEYVADVDISDLKDFDAFYSNVDNYNILWHYNYQYFN